MTGWPFPPGAGPRPGVAGGRRAAAALLATVMAVTGLAGCRLSLAPPARTPGTVRVSAAAIVPCALVVVLYRNAVTAIRTQFETMVTATARAGERVMVIDAGSRRQLGSFTAPTPPAAQFPAAPAAPPSGATSFQEAGYRHAMSAYRAATAGRAAALRARWHRELAAWASGLVNSVAGGGGAGVNSAPRSLAGPLDTAIADLTSVEQSGVALNGRQVVAVVGFGPPSTAAPSLSAGLGGASVVIADFPPSPTAQRAWRNRLRWQGAGSVVLLTRAASGQLAAVVGRDLAGTGGGN